MKLLLDTHIFLWFISGDQKLAHGARDIIRDPVNEIYMSVVSIWESIVKYQLGKLQFPTPPDVYLPKQRERHSIRSLSIDEACVSRLTGLPMLHRDPFDRILICQALQHNMTLVTVDKIVKKYSVSTL